MTAYTYTIAGKTFKASARTAAHLESTIAALKTKHPAAELRIIQGCYNTTIAASAGTHDGDAVIDFGVTGIDWDDAQAFLRSQGWACWWRHTGTWADQRSWHIHAISLGYTNQVGAYVPGQVIDYYNHAFGLAGQHTRGSDKSWFPADIKATIFDYPAYAAKEKAAVTATPSIKSKFEQIEALADQIIAHTTPGTFNYSAAWVIRRAARKRAIATKGN